MTTPSDNELRLLSIAFNNPKTLSYMGHRVKTEWLKHPTVSSLFDILLSMYRDGKNISIGILDLLTEDKETVALIKEIQIDPSGIDIITEALKHVHTRELAQLFAGSTLSKITRDITYGMGDIQQDIDMFLKSSIFDDSGKSATMIGDVVDGFRDSLIINMEKQEHYGLSIPIHSLSELVGSFHPGDLIVIAGRPSHGKSCFALEVAVHNTMSNGKIGSIHSLEMDKELLCMRLMSRTCGVNLKRITDRMLTIEDIKKIMEPVYCRKCMAKTVANETFDIKNGIIKHKCMSCGSNNVATKSDVIKEIGLIIEDKPGISANDICYQIRYFKDKFPNMSFAMIDYLQLIPAIGFKDVTKNDMIDTICQILKNLARELKITIILLSQLNREVERRQDKRPVMSDLRDSGGIEANADVILFMHWNYVYTKNREEEHYAEIVVGKQRNGPTGVVPIGVDMSVQYMHDTKEIYYGSQGS